MRPKIRTGKPAKEFVDFSGRRKVKGSMDIELAIDAMELADWIDETILFSGEWCLRPLMQAVQPHDVRITVVSTRPTQPPMVADEVRRQADVFIDLSIFGRALVEIPQKNLTASRRAGLSVISQRIGRSWWTQQ